MRVRALDTGNDWTWGKGANDYLVNLQAVEQMIQTRLLSFLGDCFFAADEGIDWFNFLGSKNELGLNLAVSATIINTPDPVTGNQVVTRLSQLSISLDVNRLLRVAYEVDTVYTGVKNPTGTLSGTVNYLITDDGSILVTDDGDRIVV